MMHQEIHLSNDASMTYTPTRFVQNKEHNVVHLHLVRHEFEYWDALLEFPLDKMDTCPAFGDTIHTNNVHTEYIF